MPLRKNTRGPLYLPHRKKMMQDSIRILSRFGPTETMDRLEAAIHELDLEVFARIDHAAGTARVSLKLTPTELIIFGSARACTPLMQLDPSIGFDLPLKTLVWQDAAGTTWIAYREPARPAQQLSPNNKVDRIIERMRVTLNTLSRKAAGEHCHSNADTSTTH